MIQLKCVDGSSVVVRQVSSVHDAFRTEVFTGSPNDRIRCELAGVAVAVNEWTGVAYLAPAIIVTKESGSSKAVPSPRPVASWSRKTCARKRKPRGTDVLSKAILLWI